MVELPCVGAAHAAGEVDGQLEASVVAERCTTAVATTTVGAFCCFRAAVDGDAGGECDGRGGTGDEDAG